MLPCSLCSDTDHCASKCPELYAELKEPGAPQPTGPRGQDED